MTDMRFRKWTGLGQTKRSLTGRAGDGLAGNGSAGDGSVGDGRVGDGRVGDGTGAPVQRPSRLRPTVWAALVLGIALAFSSASWQTSPVAGQEAPPSDTPAGDTPAAGKPATGKPEKAKRRGRLPAYFSRVVSATQRDQIYSIQAKFNTRLVELQEQISDLINERDAAVEKVLTANQMKQVEGYRAEARTRRTDRRSAAAADKGVTPADSPAGDSPAGDSPAGDSP